MCLQSLCYISEAMPRQLLISLNQINLISGILVVLKSSHPLPNSSMRNEIRFRKIYKSTSEF